MVSGEYGKEADLDISLKTLSSISLKVGYVEAIFGDSVDLFQYDIMSARVNTQSGRRDMNGRGQMKSERTDLSQKRPSPADGLQLEVVSKRPVSEHLEHGAVSERECKGHGISRADAEAEKSGIRVRDALMVGVESDILQI